MGIVGIVIVVGVVDGVGVVGVMGLLDLGLGMGARLERRQVLVIELLHTVRLVLLRLLVLLELMLLRLLLRRLALAAVWFPRRHPVGGPGDVPNLSDQAGRQREKRWRHEVGSRIFADQIAFIRIPSGRAVAARHSA